MLRHHLLLVFRNFKRHKSSFFINLIGLTAGLSCALLIYLWVSDEMQVDQFHSKRLYQVMMNEHLGDGINTKDGTPGPLAEAMAQEMPEVELAVMVSPGFWLGQSKVSTGNRKAIMAAGKFAGPDFFKAFSFPLVYGNKENILSGQKTVAISEGLAVKLFHTTDVVGKRMMWSNTEMEAENHALISGVFKNVPSNSSEQFDFLVSQDVLMASGDYRKWGNYGPNTFVVLKKGEDPELFNKKIRKYLETKDVDNYNLFIRPYADAYLYNNFKNGVLNGGRIDYVNLFTVIAIFILVIACINFMNLSTARASRRLKEVGVKKVMGASRKMLIVQYLTESLMMSFAALFISLLAVELLLPQFNNITGKQLSLHFDPALFTALLLITILTGIISGSYPALYLSGMKPSTALKGKLILSAGALWTRQGLVVFQFAVSVILIVAVMIIYKQVEYIQTTNQGFNKDNVVYFETGGKFKNNADFAIERIKKIPGVLNVSSIDRELLGDLSYTTGDFNWEGRNRKEVIRFQRADVNAGLIETLGIEMAQGRSFSKEFSADTARIIVNEAGAAAMRIKNPVGKIFTLWGVDMQIIGVVKDFHFESLHQPVKPMFIRYKPAYTNRIMVRVAAGKMKETLDALRQFHAEFNPMSEFDFKFLDQDFQAQYVAENRVAVLSRYFAILAVVISCLGLFGLASFTAEKRFKEIGIRKILGATELNVMYILSKDFIKPVLLAILIALPLGYVFGKNWLGGYAYSIDLKLWFFVAAGFLTVLISIVTVVFQAYKAAKVSPIQSIKTE
ncbi:ABC transporter permease [Pedobacter ginsengisoli]|uniref:ABC transporter permease n=1 Tax=Pedobacter ginsengisoli TaxID=363852 RepID=UPI00254D418E|nr:ABC transporter permease [Pedobacter ginsengisoli]